MRVLILGSGGREHAIADAFGRSANCEAIFVSPGNAGIALDFECVELQDRIVEFCRSQAIDMVFIGPEQPIEAGLSDFLRDKGIKVFAPSRAAANWKLPRPCQGANDSAQCAHIQISDDS
jgi:phosphoribosylamine--glycine ligase